MKNKQTTLSFLLLASFVVMFLIGSCKKKDDDNNNNNNTPANQFTDPRDGKVYKTVTIGTQTWFAENLNYATSGGSYYYNNDANLGATYGRLYEWSAAQSACPAGWHFPDTSEWGTLILNLGGDALAGSKMKEADTAHWHAPNTGATNSSGFTALPGGSWTAVGGFTDMGDYGYFWTSTPSASFPNNAYYYFFRSDREAIYQNNIMKTFAQSVRCLKD